MPRVAVIDMGSNSTRLLVADVADGSLTEIERRSQVTRLGRGVDLSGHLAGDAIDDVCDAVGGYLRVAESHAPDRLVALATSAVRDADNGEAFIAELRERFALNGRVIDGGEEARLTYLGATAGRQGRARTLVVDIGGGSTELIVGNGEGADFHASLQLGVVRHSERHLRSDPPTPEELEELGSAVRGELETVRESAGSDSPELGIAVAGTPTSLAAMELGLDAGEPAAVEGAVLGIEAIQHQLSRVAALPLAERRSLPGLHPDRAPSIVAGIVILIGVMRLFGLERITVSRHDILWGAALDAGRQ
jgi:exopolyphosphatase/guanosine-5'-triphosphate,3'-diphosphate pyrophosphatase